MKKEKRHKAKTKTEIFKKFSIWLNLPTQFLGRSVAELERFGIDDPTYQELIVIQSRADFSREYGVSQRTLCLWSKEISTIESDTHMHKFFQKFTKSLLLAFYREQMKRPTPQGILAWYEIVKGWKKNAYIMPLTTMSSLSEIEKEEIRTILQSHRGRSASLKK